MGTIRSIFNKLLEWLRRFSTWWAAQFRARHGLSRILFLFASLLILCCLCAFPLSAILPDPTPTPETAVIVEATTPPTKQQEEATTKEPATTIPTDTPVPSATTKPTETPSSAPVTPSNPAANNPANLTIAVSSANIRSGPGANYEAIAIASNGETYQIIAKNNSGDWYNVQLNDEDSGWVAASVIELEANAPSIDTALTIPAPPAVQPSAVTTAAIPATAAPAPTTPPITYGNLISACTCTSNNLNCPDFPNPGDAQQCYTHCMQQTGRDVYALDRDEDGRACEWSP